MNKILKLEKENYDKTLRFRKIEFKIFTYCMTLNCKKMKKKNIKGLKNFNSYFGNLKKKKEKKFKIILVYYKKWNSLN